MATDNLTGLLPYLRLKIGDTVEASYRYTDEWLLVALQASVKELSNWWYDRYLINTSDEIYRNPGITFEYSEPPVIQMGDETPIVIMAAIITLEGSLENSAWNFGSWKDAEISYSNIESGRARSGFVGRLWEELNRLIVPPTKKLAWAIKGSLPGFKGNNYERTSKY